MLLDQLYPSRPQAITEQSSSEGSASLQTGDIFAIDPDTGRPYERDKLAAMYGKKTAKAASAVPPVTAADTNNEPISIGGETILPSDPLYAKLKQQMTSRSIHPSAVSGVAQTPDAFKQKRAAAAQAAQSAMKPGQAAPTQPAPGTPEYFAQKRKSAAQAAQSSLTNVPPPVPVPVPAPEPMPSVFRTRRSSAAQEPELRALPAPTQLPRSQMLPPAASKTSVPAPGVVTPSSSVPTYSADNLKHLSGWKVRPVGAASRPYSGPTGYAKKTTSFKPTKKLPKLPAVSKKPAVAEIRRQIQAMLESVTCKQDIERIKTFVKQQFEQHGLVSEMAHAQQRKLLEHVVQQGALRRRQYASKNTQ